MDRHQLDFERRVGDAFVAWLNSRERRQFSFAGRPDEAPDLIYEEGINRMYLEISAAYYDEKEAAVWWGAKRKLPNAPRQWSGKDMDEMLVSDINRRLAEKCLKTYGSDCNLVLYVHPLMTTWEELESLLPTVTLPERVPFKGIYLSGFFPMSSGGSQGCYRVWQLPKAMEP